MIMEDTLDDIFRSHIICSIYHMCEPYEFFQRRCNKMWLSKYRYRMYLYEYEDISKFATKINNIANAYDIQSLAMSYHTVEDISNRKGDE